MNTYRLVIEDSKGNFTSFEGTAEQVNEKAADVEGRIFLSQQQADGLYYSVQEVK